MKGHFYCPIHSSIICNSQNVNVKAPQSCLILCDPMDCTVPGILQARILEWVAFTFSRGSSQPRDGTQVCRHYRQILYLLSHQGNPRILEWAAYSFSSRSSWPRNWTRVSCIAGGFFTNWAMRDAPKAPKSGSNQCPLTDKWINKVCLYDR